MTTNAFLQASSTKFILVNGAPIVTVAGSGGGGGGSIVPSGLSNVSGFVHGQSNALNFSENFGAGLLFAQNLSFWLGGTGTPAQTNTSASCIGGAGVYCGYPGYGTFLVWGGDSASTAEVAVYNSNGTGMIAAIDSLTSTQKANTVAILINWGETDSSFVGTGYTDTIGNYSDKPVYKAATLNDIAQIRAAFGKTAAELTVGIFGVTFGTSQGYAMVREAWAELAANPANNICYCLQQTADDVVNGDNWDPTTGLITTGNADPDHVDQYTALIFAQRCALAVARQIQVGLGLPSSDIPTIYGQGVGPEITKVVISDSTLTVTVAHDAGNDLIVPLLASQGVGWAVMDGGSNASPGQIIAGVSCTRLNNTQVEVKLAKAPSNSPTSCIAFYPYQGNFGIECYLTAWTSNSGGVCTIKTLQTGLIAQGDTFVLSNFNTNYYPTINTTFTALSVTSESSGDVITFSLPTNPGTIYTSITGNINSAQPLQLIGRGCAVTDNYSTILSEENISLPSVAGMAWNGNYPICSPISISGTGSSASATFGIVCSSS